MHYAGFVIECPVFKGITVAASTEVLKDHELPISANSMSRQIVSANIPTSIVASVYKDLLATIYVSQCEIATDELNDDDFQDYSEGFFESPSRELGWTMEKYFDKIEYDVSMKSCESSVLDVGRHWKSSGKMMQKQNALVGEEEE